MTEGHSRLRQTVAEVTDLQVQGVADRWAQ